MKATQNGNLVPLGKCWLFIPSYGYIEFNNLPDISDAKTAVYNNEGIIGRSVPLYTYSHSADRTINLQLHFFVVKESCGGRCFQCPSCNLAALRAIQSAAYPQVGNTGLPYMPPEICVLKCGDLLSVAGTQLCVFLQSYSVRFPTEVAWDEKTFCPYRFDVDTTWTVAYSSENLPFNTNIIKFGR